MVMIALFMAFIWVMKKSLQAVRKHEIDQMKNYLTKLFQHVLAFFSFLFTNSLLIA